MWTTRILASGFCLLILLCPSDSRPPNHNTFSDKKALTISEAERNFVPDYVNFYQPATFVTTIPWVDDERLRQALRFILSLEDNRFLQTPPDKINLALAREFADGKRMFITRQKTVYFSQDEHARDCRLAYDPTTKALFFGRIQATRPLLAASLYHELQHISDLENKQNASSRCDIEAAAYAAQIRFVAALIAEKLLPAELSSIETSDAGVLQMIYESWQALRQNRFCDWYTERILRGPNSFEIPGSIFDQKK